MHGLVTVVECFGEREALDVHSQKMYMDTFARSVKLSLDQIVGQFSPFV